jgi:hypothetical protein
MILNTDKSKIEDFQRNPQSDIRAFWHAAQIHSLAAKIPHPIRTQMKSPALVAKSLNANGTDRSRTDDLLRVKH